MPWIMDHTTSRSMFSITVLLSITLPGACSLKAQSSNALDFDGIDDKVVVQNASALIANAPGVSLGCWVYPTNAAPQYPDFDGFVGFRNEVDCDLYMVQIAPTTTLECRIRNSANQWFTLTYPSLDLNTWQFLMLTFDGSALTLYKNGMNVASIPASGSITSTTTPLYIGDLLFQFTDFFLDGRVDEVSLWSRTLLPAEITCMYNEGPDPSDNDLQLYYRFDQGTAGGANPGITTLTDMQGQIDGDLTGFALNGSSSNFVQGALLGHAASATICQGDVLAFGTQDLTDAGIYTEIFSTGGACDSVVTLTLDVQSVDTAVVLNGVTLQAQAGGAQYQWIDCDNGMPMVGQTAQTFTPTVNGNYALVITQSGCTDTSACHSVNTLSVQQESGTSGALIYPDPVRGLLMVRTPVAWVGGTLRILDLQGRPVLGERVVKAPEMVLDVSGLAHGRYVVRIDGPGVRWVQGFDRE
ncbi:MAG: hypothetical protein H6594_04845 [Flavobacteriales bacterium]|nr:hypothetical protein [Flavobacteriales bacterium]